MYWLVFLVMAAASADAQQTAQTSVAPDLRECYMNATLLNRNNLPPTTMPVLIDIIRLIEDNPNVNLDLRQLSVLLLHTYRQDGIEYHQPELNMATSSNVLPFAPTFHSFHRHKLLLTRIIPNNGLSLANDTVPSDLKCALHHMLSTTVDARVRGDEGSCNQLSQYRALRTIRQTRSTKARSIDDDVEILDAKLLNQANKNGHYVQYNPNDDVEFAGYGVTRSERQLGDSQCPILSGVVRTQWGAVSAGSLIAGIAAGSQPQQIPVQELVKGSSSSFNYQNTQQSVTAIYPATLSGDLAEAALIQGTERGSMSISVGVAGGWNSTQAVRHYMLQSRLNLEMTDPEIRGDIDGFVLGTKLPSILQTYSSLKLSQLLDMYYSPRNGVFDSSVRACSRRELSQTYIADNTLAGETYAFAAALDTNIPLRGTITGGLDQLVTSAVTNFQNYMSTTMNDVNCATTESTAHDYRLRTNLYIVLDSSWQYQAVYPAISYLLDYIEVSKFGSSVTLLSAFDGSVIINKTFSLAEFHSGYTLARHQSLFAGVNLETTFTNIRGMMHNQLDHERTINYVGGNSSVLLFLLNTGNVQPSAQTWEQARILNETVPDLRILFATSGNQIDALWSLVRDFHNDIITVSLTTGGFNVEASMAPVVNRIQKVGRRIINPACGSNYQVNTLSGTRQFEDFLEPGYINFYSISPNYFYQNNDNRKIRITRSSAGSGSLIVCYSRTATQPRSNSTIGDVDGNSITCQTLATTGNIEIRLQNLCEGFWTINSCPLFYISVQSVASTTTTSAVCTDRSCRFPYNIRYQVQIEDLGCHSSVSGLKASSMFIVLTVLSAVFKF